MTILKHYYSLKSLVLNQSYCDKIIDVFFSTIQNNFLIFTIENYVIFSYFNINYYHISIVL